MFRFVPDTFRYIYSNLIQMSGRRQNFVNLSNPEIHAKRQTSVNAIEDEPQTPV